MGSLFWTYIQSANNRKIFSSPLSHNKSWKLQGKLQLVFADNGGYLDRTKRGQEVLLAPGPDQVLLVRRSALFSLDFSLHTLNGVSKLNVKLKVFGPPLPWSLCQTCVPLSGFQSAAQRSLSPPQSWHPRLHCQCSPYREGSRSAVDSSSILESFPLVEVIASGSNVLGKCVFSDRSQATPCQPPQSWGCPGCSDPLGVIIGVVSAFRCNFLTIPEAAWRSLKVSDGPWRFLTFYEGFWQSRKVPDNPCHLMYETQICKF